MGTHQIENWTLQSKECQTGQAATGKMWSHINFKLGFSKKALDLVKGFLFQFSVI